MALAPHGRKPEADRRIGRGLSQQRRLPPRDTANQVGGSDSGSGRVRPKGLTLPQSAMPSYFRNRGDGVFAKHEGELVYIWDPSTNHPPRWSIMPAEVLANDDFEPFCIGTEAEFLDMISEHEQAR